MGKRMWWEPACGFPCPVCKAKLLVDRRTLPGEEGAPTTVPAVALPAADAHADHHEETDAFGAKALLLGVDHQALRPQAAIQEGNNEGGVG